MTRMPETAPTQRQAVRATQLAGFLISIAGIAVIVFALVLANTVGASPRWQQETGYFLIALAGFLVSAGGTELRHNAKRLSR